MHWGNTQFTPVEISNEAETVARAQCQAWRRVGARPADLYRQVTGRAPQAPLNWDQVARTFAANWHHLRHGRS